MLIGSGRYPTIVLVSNPTHAHALAYFTGGHGRIGFVRLSGNGLLADTCCTTVVSFKGNSNVLDDALVTTASSRQTGIDLLCHCSGNRIVRDRIYGNKLGLIFGPYNSPRQVNTVDASHIHGNACDGVTFQGANAPTNKGGFGAVVNSTLDANGGRCPNGIPAAGVYSLGDLSGGRISGNHIYDNCGNDVDLVSGAGFTITRNMIDDPGHQFSGATLTCAGAGANLLNVQSSKIVDNTVTNDDNAHNAVPTSGDPNHIYEASGAALYSDLPNHGQVAIAFVLAYSLSESGTTTGNHISDNVFQANCSGSCIGLGYFASRDTGYDASLGWSAETTNYYTGNNPNGSNIGSVRGGGNWYAADTSCTEASSPPPCNTDDSQHPTSVNWARNDGFFFY